MHACLAVLRQLNLPYLYYIGLRLSLSCDCVMPDAVCRDMSAPVTVAVSVTDCINYIQFTNYSIQIQFTHV